ncbi:MAG: hypothetical protein PHP45_07100 [Elusimicrobiales bacterium]|nr:hypothetical protein [Elusimicrobiales bacterium]
MAGKNTMRNKLAAAAVFAFALCPVNAVCQTGLAGTVLSGGDDLLSAQPIAKVPAPRATAEIIINATEMGVGGFHRYDNKAHDYGKNNAQSAHIPPDHAESGELAKAYIQKDGSVKIGFSPIVQKGQHPVVVDQGKGVVSVQFESLEELLKTIVAVAKQKQAKIAVFNINAHGAPGMIAVPQKSGNRFPKEKTDEANYKDYYSTYFGKERIFELREGSKHPEYGLRHIWYPSNLQTWREVISEIPDIKSYFTEDAQIHFLACLVGLGPLGKDFTENVAALLLDGDKAAVQTSTAFGAVDWSMPEGMGFWDYQNDEQLKHDQEVYPVHREDRETRQKAAIRLAYKKDGKWTSVLVGNQDFMTTGRKPLDPGNNIVPEPQ